MKRAVCEQLASMGHRAPRGMRRQHCSCSCPALHLQSGEAAGLGIVVHSMHLCHLMRADQLERQPCRTRPKLRTRMMAIASRSRVPRRCPEYGAA